VRARGFLKEIASEFGLEAVQVWDTDMDILLPEGKTPRGLRGKLRKYGYRYSEPTRDEETNIVTLHIHAPMRKKKSWFDRGWDWEIPNTPSILPGEGPLIELGEVGEN